MADGSRGEWFQADTYGWWLEGLEFIVPPWLAIERGTEVELGMSVVYAPLRRRRAGISEIESPRTLMTKEVEGVEVVELVCWPYGEEWKLNAPVWRGR